jgi:Na+/phosphate symporter
MDTKLFLEDLFQSPVDLVTMGSIKPRLLPIIQREALYARDSRAYLEDILEATRKITSYTANLSKAPFLEDEKTLDAVVRNLEVIGEAVKKLPEDLRAQHPSPRRLPC